MNILVDTNVISELRRGRNADSRVLRWFGAIAPENVFTSVIVLGELRRGIELLARRDRRQADTLAQWYDIIRERLADRVLVVDEPVMTVWARISTPDILTAYDGLIAATALRHGLTVATRNLRDYRRSGVQVVNPWEQT